MDMTLDPLQVQSSFWNDNQHVTSGGQQDYIYLLAEIYGRDEVGSLERVRGCWYVTVSDQNHPMKCGGNYALQGVY
jgi:hypothetical protein